MKAIAVTPGKPDTVHLRDVPKAYSAGADNGRGVLVKVRRVGVDGTDKEINVAEYGAAPTGDDSLIQAPAQVRTRRYGQTVLRPAAELSLRASVMGLARLDDEDGWGLYFWGSGAKRPRSRRK